MWYYKSMQKINWTEVITNDEVDIMKGLRKKIVMEKYQGLVKMYREYFQTRRVAKTDFGRN